MEHIATDIYLFEHHRADSFVLVDKTNFLFRLANGSMGLAIHELHYSPSRLRSMLSVMMWKT